LQSLIPAIQYDIQIELTLNDLLPFLVGVCKLTTIKGFKATVQLACSFETCSSHRRVADVANLLKYAVGSLGMQFTSTLKGHSGFILGSFKEESHNGQIMLVMYVWLIGVEDKCVYEIAIQ
jgi:hypothetical protein